MVDVYKNIEKYNPGKELKILIVFDDILSNEKLNLIVTELFFRERKLNIFLVCRTQPYFAVPKKLH